MAGSPESKSIKGLYDALRDLAAWMHADRLRHCVIGGVAVSLLGEPRTTLDIDATAWLEPDQCAFALKSGARFGFSPRVADPCTVAQTARMLLLIHRKSRVPVDISLAALPMEAEILRRARVHEVEGVPITLPAVSDLILMKASAGRPQDWADIATLLDMNPRVSLQTIRKRLRAWCEIVESVEAIEQFETFLQQRRRRG